MKPVTSRSKSAWFTVLATGLVLSYAVPAGAAIGRIDAITLSAGGMAEVVRTAPVAADGAVRLTVPLEHVDDILKSLVVLDTDGQVVGMTLAGQAPVDETFARLPVTPADLVSVATLAAALQGVPVRATSRGRSVEGAVLGVAPPDAEAHEDAGWPVLSVLTTAGQVQSLALATDAALDILDAELLGQINLAARVSGQARTEHVRELSLTLTGTAQDPVAIRYVVPTPVWKTAFRLLLADEGARLQAWAVLENATGEDWREVELTLSSGAPVMLSQALYRRYWHQRPEVPVAAAAAAPPPADRAVQRKFAGAPLAAAPVYGGAARELASAAPAPAPVAPPALAAQAEEGRVAANYRLPQRVSLPAGQTLAAPYIDSALPAEAISVFQPERGSRHPIAAVLLENTTAASLPSGILTVYDAGGRHLGDAQLAGLPVGETRIVSFAEDRKVEITVDTEPLEQVVQVKVVEGVLHAVRSSRLKTTYRVKGAADAPRAIMVEHPRRANWQFRSTALVGETPTHHRLRLDLKSGATATLETLAERQHSEHIALADMNTDALLSWSGQALDTNTANRLQALAQKRRELTRSEQQEQTLQSALDRAVANQARIRENLGAVRADSALGLRYTEMLAQEEDRIAVHSRELEAAREQTQRLRQDLHAQLAS